MCYGRIIIHLTQEKEWEKKLDDLKAGANCDFQKTIDKIEVNKLGAKKTRTHTIQDLLSFCNYRFSSAQQVIMLITCYIAYVQVCILFTSAILLWLWVCESVCVPRKCAFVRVQLFSFLSVTFVVFSQSSHPIAYRERMCKTEIKCTLQLKNVQMRKLPIKNLF